MTTLTLDIDTASRPAAGAATAPARPEGTRPAPPRPEVARSAPAPTLDDLVARTWSALLVSRAAPCLLCGGEVTPRYSSGPHPVGGTCRSCGTEMA